MTGTINGNIFIGLKIETGIYSYGDIVSATIEKKAGVELDANISENIKCPDMFSYDEFRDDYLDINVKASAAFKAEAKLFRWLKLSAKYEILSGKINIYKYRLVPTFTEPNVYLRYSSENPYAVVSIIPDDNLIFPVSLGIGLWDESNSLLDAQFCESTYSDRKSWPIDEYSTTFQHLTFNKDYTVRPLIKLFEGMIVAPQEVDFKGPEIKPVTLAVPKVDETIAEVRGRIYGHELLDNTMTFGLAYEEPESQRIVRVSTSSIDEDGIFYVTFKGLKPNTYYNYFAYLIIDGKEYQGEKRRFKTKEYKFKEPYFVWDDANKIATYYYDNKRKNRGGVIIDKEHDVYFDGHAEIQTVILDSSFSKYYPKRFWFIWCEELKEIKNLNYLNTDSITDMSAMFLNCRSLTSLNLSNFNTSNVTIFGYIGYASEFGMFRGCSSLTSLDLSSFDTSNATDMIYMFYGCSSLTSLDLSSFNTSNVTNMSFMFQNCTSLKILDLSGFRFNASHDHFVPDLNATFDNCSSLTTIYAGNWGSDYFTNRPPFSRCPKLRGGKGTRIGQNLYGYDENGNPLYYYVEDYRTIYARIDGGKDSPGLFTAK